MDVKEEIGNGEFLKDKASTVNNFFEEGDSPFQMQEDVVIPPVVDKEVDKPGDAAPADDKKPAEEPAKQETKPKDNQEDGGEKPTFFGDEPGGDPENAEGFTILPFIEAIHEKFGWEFDPEAFKDADASKIETLTDYITTIIEENSKPEYANNISASFDDYLRKGGNPEEFFEYYNTEVNYTDLDLTDKDTLRIVGIDYYMKTGQTREDAIETVNDLEETNALARLAPKFVNQLDSWQKSETEQNEAARAQSLQREYEAAEKALENTYKLIQSKDEIAGLPFKNKEDKDKFFEFGYVPDKKGETPYHKLFKADPEMELKMLMFAYRGIDKKKIVEEMDGILKLN